MQTANPDLFILSRCAKEDNYSKLIRAGANKVINPYTAGGHRMAEILLKPQVEDSISVVSPKHSDLNLTLDEISFKGLNQYAGVLIKDSNIREEYDIMIVGIIKERNGSVPDTLHIHLCFLLSHIIQYRRLCAMFIHNKHVSML